MKKSGFYSLLFAAFLLLFSIPGRADITTGLVAHYVMNDNAASTTVVESVSSNNGTLVGGNTDAKTTTGPGGSLTAALDLDGTGDCIYQNSGAVTLLMSTSASFSVAVWARVDAYAGSGEHYFVVGQEATNNRFNLGIDMDTDIVSTTAIDGTGTVAASLASAQATLGTTWHHYCATWNQGTRTLTLYIDGSAAGGTTQISNGALTDDLAVFGGRVITGTSDPHNGPLADLRIYSRALSGSDVDELVALSVDSGSAVPAIMQYYQRLRNR